jgi:prevent-host-death family protein
MAERVSTLEIRQRLGDYLNRVALRHDQFIIERKGKPVAALVPVAKLEAMDRASRTWLLELLESRPDTGLTEEEADRIADEAKHRSRPKQRQGTGRKVSR